MSPVPLPSGTSAERLTLEQQGPERGGGRGSPKGRELPSADVCSAGSGMPPPKAAVLKSNTPLSLQCLELFVKIPFLCMDMNIYTYRFYLFGNSGTFFLLVEFSELVFKFKVQTKSSLCLFDIDNPLVS